MRTPKEVYNDYAGRRLAIIRALTEEQELFFKQADPAKENMCLYGYPDGCWSVDVPPQEVPAEVPEPAVGINFARDGMQRKDWIGLAAIHSDAWLMSLSFYKGARLDQDGRQELFALINKLPTIFEVVSGRVAPAPAPAPKSAAKPAKTPTADPMAMAAEDEDDEYEDGDGDPCPQCGKLYSTNEFWIACDFCDTWYCGRCAKMTEAKAEKVDNWKCPQCTGA